MIGFIVFLTIFLSIYGLMHFYVLARLTWFFSINRGIIFYSMLAFLTISYVGSRMLIAYYTNIAVRFLYAAASVWMGIIFLFFSTLIVYEIVRLFIKPKPVISGICVCVFVCIITFYAVVNALCIRIRSISVDSPKLTKQLRIVQLSDIHSGSVHRKDLIKKIVKKTQALNPDIVCITGDLIDRNHHNHEILMPFKDLKVPIFFITGNHEEYVGLENVSGLLKGTGITFLRNEVYDFKGMQIIGIDDSNDKKQVAKILSHLDIDSEKYTILLYHRPVDFVSVQNAGVDLMLTGHMHAGQIFPFNLIIRFFYKHICGLHTYGNLHMYVSPGTGTWGPPMRLGSRNEITLIRVVPQFLAGS